MNATITNLETRIEAVEESVNGNGQPGLKTRVALVEKEIELLSKIEARTARLEKIAYVGIGSLGALQMVLKLWNH